MKEKVEISGAYTMKTRLDQLTFDLEVDIWQCPTDGHIRT